MKTWRERIVEAREAGRFNYDDMFAWTNSCTCPVGEGVARIGLESWTVEWWEMWKRVDEEKTAERSLRALHAINTRDFDGLDALLDEIEDRVLELKREAAP